MDDLQPKFAQIDSLGDTAEQTKIDVTIGSRRLRGTLATVRDLAAEDPAWGDCYRAACAAVAARVEERRADQERRGAVTLHYGSTPGADPVEQWRGKSTDAAYKAARKVLDRRPDLRSIDIRVAGQLVGRA